MSTLAVSEKGRSLSPSQRSALVRLLEDDDPGVSAAVQGRILECGDEALGWLQPYLLERDPAIRRRVQDLMDQLGRQKADSEFLSFCLNQGEDFDLEEGMWRLVLTRYPAINVAAYQALLDEYSSGVAEDLPAGSEAELVLGALNRHLFERLEFSGNELDYYDPENSYLNRVLDRRVGNPVSLCLIYLLVARRLRLPVSGIGMPGHFLCRYQTPKEEYFVDAFNRGRLLTKADCIRYLVQVSYGYQEGLLSPASSRRILLRVCSNLHQVYLHRKDREEINRLQRYVVALAR